MLGKRHRREVVTALNAPPAIGPYAHAIRSGDLLFCSGQIPIDPETGELDGTTPGAQARRCLRSLEAVCAAAGAQLSDAVRTTIYVTDIEAFAEVNDAFPADPPARSTVAVAALPRGAQVEIDAIVALPG